MPWSVSHLPVILIIKILQVYNVVIIARVLLSWFIQDPCNQIYRFLCKLTDPVLAPIRRIIPITGLDFSPVVVMIAIQAVIGLLYRLV